MKPEQTINFLDGCTLEIYIDESPESPREWDNLGTMVCLNKRYEIGDKHDYKSGNYNGWDEIEEAIVRDNPGCLIRPLYLMDHSGLSLSMMPFGCPWDSGKVGFIFITKERINGELKGNLQRVNEVLQAEVETYNQYLSGDIYGYILRDKPCDKCGCNTKSAIVDSCWGFYSSDVKENGMLDHLSKEHRDEINGKVK
jgi:hypothetical protein